MNHNDNPNCQIVYNNEKDYRKLYSITLRDIKAGEEITQAYWNYFSKKGKWVLELMSKYEPERLSFESEL